MENDSTVRLQSQFIIGWLRAISRSEIYDTAKNKVGVFEHSMAGLEQETLCVVFCSSVCSIILTQTEQISTEQHQLTLSAVADKSDFVLLLHVHEAHYHNNANHFLLQLTGQ